MTEVRLEVEDGVATITLDAPDRRNALTASMADELVAACDEADDDRSVGAVVLQATGASFCAGADRALLAAAASDPVGDEAFEAIGKVYRAFLRVGELAAPTVAAVRGHAVGAGLNLVLATDLRIVGEESRLMSGFLKIGLHPGGGHYSLLARAGGREVAAAVGLFGEEVVGRRAVELGLAWECVSSAQVETRAREVVLAAARDPELARAAVRSLRIEVGPPTLPWSAAVEVERGVQTRSFRRLADGRS